VASGANYVARGFSGDPDGLAELILDGIRWPGFAFIEVLSPCITFRPEQREWKKMVRPSTLTIEQDRAAATALVLADDGFSMGVLYRGDRAAVAPASKPEIEVADIEREFTLA
jgi:2-oxoglutarate ferredoxin oxidoreductase subunit beta